MTRPALDRAVLSSRLAQIAQLMGTYDSKTDQTAQSDQRIGNAEEIRRASRSETDQPPSETDQRNCPSDAFSCARCAESDRSRPRRGGRAGAAAMSALPLLEAVRRAGGTIALQGDRLRLSAPEPLPRELLEEVRLHKADLIDQLRSAARPLLREPPAAPPRPGTAAPTGTIATWADGVARLRQMPPPRHYREHAWQQLIVDADRFLDCWSQQAVALGWPDWELFGCHKARTVGPHPGHGPGAAACTAGSWRP